MLKKSRPNVPLRTSSGLIDLNFLFKQNDYFVVFVKTDGQLSSRHVDSTNLYPGISVQLPCVSVGNSHILSH
ncbi:hypothetical protein L6452_02460 [Arctium lappa]|uniref:Uncharacterized protein n=1 Tax=Arctium lappa TaxID=4217 RepID=A0ACB9FK40_ARCLA|nr:hypothetical protein L6452_02460 [Arctium lappa]